MLTARAGNIKDSDFIVSCLLSGARKGLFAIDTDRPECVNSMRAEIRLSLTHHRVASGAPAQTLVYSEQNRRAGFAIVVGNPMDSLELELYAIAVAQKYQGVGFGAWILDEILTNFDYVRFYARCSDRSVTMQRMLERRTFRQIDTNELGYSIMVLDRSQAPPDCYSGLAVEQLAV
jgi:ribosomal protein S18 acetylase RimI-like enzyme